MLTISMTIVCTSASKRTRGMAAALAMLALHASIACGQEPARDDAPDRGSLQVEAAAMICTERLEKFVGELDQAITDVSSIDVIIGLFKKYFPLEKCDIEKAIKICSKSKYFTGSRDSGTFITITFNRPKTYWRLGVDVSFGLTKDDGNSRLPFAIVRT